MADDATQEVVFPDREDLGKHPFDPGPLYVAGRWVRGSRAANPVEPRGTMCRGLGINECHPLWISDGAGRWAGVSIDGRINGYIAPPAWNKNYGIFVPAHSAAKVPVAGGAWNARCPRCSRGIYVGFTSVEHEGGGCP